MIGESFLDVCLRACIKIPDTFKNHKELFANIFIVLKWYKEETPKDKVPIEYGNKLDLVYILAGYRIKLAKFNPDILIEKISTGMYSSFVTLLTTIAEKNGEISQEEFDELFETILNKRKACEVLKGKKKFQNLLNDIECGNYTDDIEVISRWEDCLSTSYRNYMNLKKSESIEKAESLDVLNDNLSPVLDKIRNSSNTENTLKTGYTYLENILPSKGFEDRRLYLIGGTSGVGKSTKLINLICNAVSHNKIVNERQPTFLYITAENLIDESWIRFYCCLTGMPHSDFVNIVNDVNELVRKTEDENSKIDIISKFDAKLADTIKYRLSDANANVVFKYVEPKRTTIKDVEAIVDTVASEYNLRAVFIDYLDLIRVGIDIELRHELGMVAQCFKNMSIIYSVPVITATQLNRTGYAPDTQPSLTQMSESMEKVDNSDFVLFLQQGKDKRVTYPATDGSGQKTVKIIRVSVLKNRSGKEGDMFACEMPLLLDGKSVFNYRMLEMPKIRMEDLKVAASVEVGEAKPTGMSFFD